jgi:hypothetical protein
VSHMPRGSTWAGAVVGITTTVVSVWLAYDLLAKGPIPEKRLDLSRPLISNPLRDLAPLGDTAKATIVLDNDTVENLFVASTSLQNAGQSPILPSDYFENLSVSVEAPFKILSVTSGEGPVQLRWNRVSDQRFEAEPALLNPSDSVFVQVYLTDGANRPELRAAVFPDIPITWAARITNLPAITEPVPSLSLTSGGGFVVIHVVDWWATFLVAVALVFFVGYVQLMGASALLPTLRPLSLGLLVGASLLSFAAAESITHLLSGGYLPGLLSPWNALNGTVLLIHLAVFGFLLWRSRKKPAPPGEAPDGEEGPR